MDSVHWQVHLSLPAGYLGMEGGRYYFQTLTTGQQMSFDSRLQGHESLEAGLVYLLQINREKDQCRAIRHDVGFTHYNKSEESDPLSVPRGIPSTIRVADPEHYVRISMLDVGQGDSTFIEDSTGHFALIDFGSKKNAEVTIPQACTFILQRLTSAIDTSTNKTLVIDLLCFTHGDADHYNQFDALLAHVNKNGFTLETRQTCLGGKPGDYPSDFLKTLASLSADMSFFEKDTQLPKLLMRSDYLNLTLLSVNEVPTHSGESVKNCSSLVILIRVTDARGVTLAKYLVMGDAEETVERVMMGTCSDEISDVDALHVGHHGSSKACCEDFLAVTRPRIAYVSTDTKWAHPYNDLMERLRACPSLASSTNAHPVVVSNTRSNLDYQQQQESTAIYTTLMEVVPDPREESKKLAKTYGSDVEPVSMTGARHDFYVEISTGKLYVDNSESTQPQLEEVAARSV